MSRDRSSVGGGPVGGGNATNHVDNTSSNPSGHEAAGAAVVIASATHGSDMGGSGCGSSHGGHGGGGYAGGDGGSSA